MSAAETAKTQLAAPAGGVDAWWREVSAHLGELLPSQGPISVFIHHNTLHGFEDRGFDDAVAAAAEKLSCEPYLAEEDYRREFERGRITDRDLDWALRRELGAEAARSVLPGLTLLELRVRLARFGVPAAAGPSLAWLTQETDALRRWREDLPADARETLLSSEPEALWKACCDAVGGYAARPAPAPREALRHRDLLLAAEGVDTDAWVNPALIRLVGAFLDQGVARWSMPGRARGLYACFLELYSHPWAGLCGEWARALPGLIAQERSLGLGATASIRRSLEVLGVGPDERLAFLEATALSLRGWAGMVRLIEQRPDRVPAQPLPAALADFMAARLLLERCALEHAVRSLPAFAGELGRLRERLRARAPAAAQPSTQERAWRLFHGAQLCGLAPARVEALSSPEAEAFAAELDAFSGAAVRRILQSAYDRHLGSRLCDALASRAPAEEPKRPAFQAVFCLDDREESFRRHLEETVPEAETLGAAGFFGVAMYYQGAADAHPRPLCPIAITPRHYVGEVKTDPSAALVRWRHARRRGAGRLGKLMHLLGGTVLGGYAISTLAGPLSLLPLVLRVVFPGLSRRWAKALPFSRTPPTRLLLDRQAQPPPAGELFGFTKEEMARIVSDQLRGMGVADRLAPLVLVLGHGSASLNNPHGSAYDCGACGGGRGGANGRAFAQMANDPAVRALLAAEGLRVPAETWFVGGLRNTGDNSVDFFDLERLPDGHIELFDRVATAFAHVRRKEAHERCRRFESFPLSGGHGAALAHVEARSHDLAQPRPECGHATNAYSIIGRRSRTRGLFLDRRAFLTSYDPDADPDGRILERTLSAVMPVVAGISLEYYFSRVDPAGYGCATKLPHNVASLLGVMDGTRSDLRTGLPVQMTELHEPVRLFTVVEAPTERLDAVLARLPDVKRLLDGGWVIAACLDPRSGRLRLREGPQWRDWSVEAPTPRVAGESAAWYRGRRGHLPIAEIVSR